jgi:serine/threonine-protein kinase
MLAGRMPFEGPPAVVARQVLTEDLPPLSALHPGLSAFDDVIGRATARSAQQRFASTDEFLLALNRVEFDASSASSGPTPAPAPTTTSTLARSPAPPAPQAATAAWKRAAQPALVAALAEVAGPMAPLLVEDAMRDAVTLEQCHEILAARITDPAARARLTALTRPRAAAIPADQRGGWPLPAAATLELRNVLGGEIGPMAALLVDRAAARAQSRVEFVELLTVMLPAGVPSERWLPTLRL